jgi:pimeloyl-ACP methyl ester carboxylesterase
MPRYECRATGDFEGSEESMTATVNGVRLSYSDVGRGTPLFCLHGGMGVDAASLHVPGILDLAQFGIRLIIPDQRGHGKSQRTSPSDYSHQVWAADVRELAQCLGLRRFVLLGHSYGGFLALEYAKRWPESLTHLILVATSAGPISAPAANVLTDADLREHFRSIWPRFFVRDDKHWPLFESLQFSADAYTAAFARELPGYDLRRHVAGLDVPTLLIVGQNDPYRVHMEWLAAHLPRPTLCTINGSGHFPFIEAATEFRQCVAAFIHERDEEHLPAR